MASESKPQSNRRKSSDGKSYEKLIEGVMGAFSEGPSRVQRDVKVRGVSGRTRQIDLLGEGNLFGEPATVAVECKDHKRPIGIGVIDEFIGKLDDISADLGILYSSSGFDAGAKERAQRKGPPRVILREYNNVAWLSVDEIMEELYIEYASLIRCSCPKCGSSRTLGDPNYDGDVGEQCDRCDAVIGICASCEEVKVINEDGRVGEFPCDCYPGIFIVTQSGGVVRVTSRRGDPDWGHGNLAWTPSH